MRSVAREETKDGVPQCETTAQRATGDNSSAGALRNPDTKVIAARKAKHCATCGSYAKEVDNEGSIIKYQKHTAKA